MSIYNLGNYNNSLLNMMNSSGSAASSLFDGTTSSIFSSYQSSSSLAFQKAMLKYYEKNNETLEGAATNASVKKASNTLQSSASKLMDTGKDSLFANAKEKGDMTALTNQIQSFVVDYNAMLDKLKQNITSDRGMDYVQMHNITKAYSKRLAEVGITVNSQGLSVDQEKLKSAGAEDLEKLFGGTNSFTASIYKKAVSMGNRAESYETANLTGLYGNSGNYNPYLGSSYGSYYNKYY